MDLDDSFLLVLLNGFIMLPLWMLKPSSWSWSSSLFRIKNLAHKYQFFVHHFVGLKQLFLGIEEKTSHSTDQIFEMNSKKCCFYWIFEKFSTMTESWVQKNENIATCPISFQIKFPFDSFLSRGFCVTMTETSPARLLFHGFVFSADSTTPLSGDGN